MVIQAGTRVTNKEGYHGIVVEPGESSKVLSLSSGHVRDWPLNSYSVDERQDVGSVFVVNPPALKVSTIMLGVFLGNLLAGIVGAVMYAVAR